MWIPAAKMNDTYLRRRCCHVYGFVKKTASVSFFTLYKLTIVHQMSHFLQFAPAEDTNMKRVAKSIITTNRTVNRFKQMGKQRAAKREEVRKIKDQWTLKNPGTVNNYDRHVGSVSDINGVQKFTETTKGGQPIQDIPFMTEGLAYVLNNNKINTVAQLLAKFIELNDGVIEAIDICKGFNEWLNKITTGTIAEEGDVKIGYDETLKKAKVAVTMIIARYADDRGLISDELSEDNVYEFFRG